MKAVIDTNVYVSMLFSPRGAGAWLMAIWSERRFEIIISPELFAELVEVLNRADISPHVDGQRKLALFRRLRYDAIWTAGRVVASGELPDPGDNFLLSAALEAEAEFIVTWDVRLLEHGSSQGVQIISPDQLISLIVRTR
ncbi:MAG TPA: putative toxin-antitoxin system toxin component, PIN family [Anaerolineales bacterium]|nr:putative toxin-antitoxin system toxin component, PIN family [Anaerolineales bacterium]